MRTHRYQECGFEGGCVECFEKAPKAPRATVRIPVQTMSELVYGDDDSAHDDREFYNQLQWDGGRK